MNEMLLPERRLLGAQAWRVTFNGERRGARDAIAGSTEAIEVDAALVGSPVAADGALIVIWLPTGGAVQADVEKTADRWIGQGAGDRPAVRANVRTSTVVWTPARAVVHAHPDQWEDARDAVMRFTLMARATGALEQEMQAVWPALDRHAGLSHAVKLRHQVRQGAINRMTETVTRMRMSLLQVTAALEQVDPNLSAASKRLCAELILQAGLYDRLEVLEEPIQFALDHYELANSRLIDHRTASVEIILTLLITVALLIQTIMIFQDLPK
jgi:hypothetical protein